MSINFHTAIIAASRRRVVAPPGDFDPDRFVVRVDTNLRASSTTVLIPVSAKTGVDRTIDWGDGEVTVENLANPTHTYASNGVYTIQMYGGTTARLGQTGTSPNAGWTQPLTEIVQWGKAIGWNSFQDAFRACAENFLIPTEIPTLADGYAANVTTLRGMFNLTPNFNQDISGWNIGAVTDIQGMFLSASTFNQDISGWNIGAVTSIRGIFFNASTFNQNIGGWNTGAVTDMFSAFQNTPFNQDIGGWPLRTGGVNMGNLLNASGMSTENYSRSLIGWANSVAANSDLPENVTLGATGRTYNNTEYVSGQTYNDAVAARAYLTSAPLNWTIDDAGQV